MFTDQIWYVFSFLNLEEGWRFPELIMKLEGKQLLLCRRYWLVFSNLNHNMVWAAHTFSQDNHVRDVLEEMTALFQKNQDDV